jgi:hypothetical protein
MVPTFYNGVTGDSSIQTLKDQESSYILARGYPGPNPTAGEQIGVLNGVSLNQTVSAMRKVFKRGDVITAMVYNGTIYRKPAFDLSIDNPVKSSADIGPDGSALQFQITLTPRNNFGSSGVEFSATGLEDWADWSFGSGGPNSTYSVPVTGTTTVTLRVSASEEVSGIRTVLVRAYDPATANFKTLSATVVVGSDASYSMSCVEGYKVIEQGSSTRFDIDLQGWNSYPDGNVTVRSPEWYSAGTPPAGISAPAGISVSTPGTVQVRDGHPTNLRVNLSSTGVAAVGSWLLKISVTDGNSSRDQSIYLNVQSILSGTGPSAGNSTSFVNLLGYANFVITYANNASTPGSQDNNTIFGYAVGPLVSSPGSLARGLSPRLISWGQAR